MRFMSILEVWISPITNRLKKLNSEANLESFKLERTIFSRLSKPSPAGEVIFTQKLFDPKTGGIRLANNNSEPQMNRWLPRLQPFSAS